MSYVMWVKKAQCPQGDVVASGREPIDAEVAVGL